jgi:hypothetical protein
MSHIGQAAAGRFWVEVMMWSGPPVTAPTLARGIFISAPRPLLRRHLEPPFFGHLLPDLVLQGELADLALGVPESSVLLGGSSLAFQALLAGVQELVPPGSQAKGFDPHLPTHLLEPLASQQTKHHIQLLVG